MSITINNPTQLSFKHDKLRAENVTIIPTPNNSSDLATMITDYTYYDIGIDSECRYKKVITPKPNVKGTNYYKKDGKPVGAKVCHYGLDSENKHYEVDNGIRTVNFDVNGVMINKPNILDSEIFFKDSDDAPLYLTVFKDDTSVTLENNSTKTNFSFNVPTCVHKVEIEHNTSADSQDAPDKAKIHIELDEGGNTYYIAEKRNTINGKTSVKVLTNIYNKNLRNVATTAGKQNEFLKVDLGNGYIYFCSVMGGNIYRAYWDSKVGDTEHIYSFTDGNGGYTIQSFNESLGDRYEFLMKFSEFEEKYSNIKGTRQSTLEETQNTLLLYQNNPQSVEASDLGHYIENKRNYTGLYTFCKEFFSNESIGYFFLAGTNHIFKINVGADYKMNKTYTLNETDIENGLEVFTGGTFTTKDDAVIDDTYTTQLNFGTLCNELAKDPKNLNILSSSNTESSTNS